MKKIDKFDLCFEKPELYCFLRRIQWEKAAGY